jgi:hypothetical protein
MIKRILKYTSITLALLIGGGVAVDRVEEYRITNFCNSIPVGSNFEDALKIANNMFGVKLYQSPNSESLFIESRFAFFRFCEINGANTKVIKVFTKISISCHVTTGGLLDCRQ